MPKQLKNQNRLLAQLSAEDRASIGAHLSDFDAPAGTVLQEFGRPIEQVYFLHSGLVSLRNIMQNGSAVEVAAIGNESIIGGTLALKGPYALSTAIVQLPIRSSRISKSMFLRCLAGNQSLQDAVLRTTESLLEQMQQISACNASHHIESRLARKLLQSDDSGAGEAFLATQEFLSEILAVRRTSVTAAARTLQDAGLIRYSRGKVEILDRNGLIDRACECYSVIAEQHRRQMLV